MRPRHSLDFLFPSMPALAYGGWEGCGNGRDDHPGYTIIYGAMSLRRDRVPVASQPLRKSDLSAGSWSAQQGRGHLSRPRLDIARSRISVVTSQPALGLKTEMDAVGPAIERPDSDSDFGIVAICSSNRPVLALDPDPAIHERRAKRLVPPEAVTLLSIERPRLCIYAACQLGRFVVGFCAPVCFGRI